VRGVHDPQLAHREPSKSAISLVYAFSTLRIPRRLISWSIDVAPRSRTLFAELLGAPIDERAASKTARPKPHSRIPPPKTKERSEAHSIS